MIKEEITPKASGKKASEKWWDKKVVWRSGTTRSILFAIEFEDKALYDNLVSLEAKIEELKWLLDLFDGHTAIKNALAFRESEYQSLIKEHNLS